MWGEISDFDYLKIIKNSYTKEFIDLISKSHPRPVDPYIFNWIDIFTPIEHNVWSYIRWLGLPFYPQFPVKNYFIDFADPVYKIGIEADGIIYHDPDRDDLRDTELKELGWEIIRIRGRDTYADLTPEEYEYKNIEYIFRELCLEFYPHIKF